VNWVQEKRRWDILGHLPTQPANNPNPKWRKQPKTNSNKNAIATLLLLKSLIF
jgi:hypothetical protein